MTLFMRDLENREMGIEEGIEQGIEQGKSQRDKEIIGVMLRKGRSAEEITEITDYPLELVQAVQESLLVTQ